MCIYIHPFIHFSTVSSLPRSPLSFIMKNHSFKFICARDVTHKQRVSWPNLQALTGVCLAACTHPILTHIWRSDGKQIGISVVQTFLRGRALLCNQDLSKWIEPRTTDFIFHYFLFFWLCNIRLMPDFG